MKKECFTCKTEKNRSEYRKDNTKSDGLAFECKICARKHQRSLYTTRYYQKYRPIQNDRIAENVRRINEYKLSGCTLCPERELICLDLHHVDPAHKDFGVSTMRTFKWERIELELKKCIVVCRNCHAKVHAGLLAVQK